MSSHSNDHRSFPWRQSIILLTQPVTAITSFSNIYLAAFNQFTYSVRYSTYLRLLTAVTGLCYPARALDPQATSESPFILLLLLALSPAPCPLTPNLPYTRTMAHDAPLTATGPHHPSISPTVTSTAPSKTSLTWIQYNGCSSSCNGRKRRRTPSPRSTGRYSPSSQRCAQHWGTS